MTEVIAARHRDTAVRLKWHKLRRDPADLPFSRANLAAGLAAGATMEVDLRLLADDVFAILHEAVLEAETDGVGPVRGIDSAGLGRLRQKSGTEPPLTLVELVQTLADAADLGARLQLDLKESAADIGPQAVARFRATVAPVAKRLILSGQDADAVRRLAVPGLALGFDPIRLWRGQEPDGFIAETLAAMPGMAMCYLKKDLLTGWRAQGFDAVAPFHARGIEVDVWTIDATGDPAHLVAALALGADQITTNGPAALAEAIIRRLPPEA